MAAFSLVTNFILNFAEVTDVPRFIFEAALYPLWISNASADYFIRFTGGRGGGRRGGGIKGLNNKNAAAFVDIQMLQFRRYALIDPPA